VDVKDSFEAGDSGLIVIGRDRGEGFAIRFAASVDEARGGIFTRRDPSFLVGGCSGVAKAVVTTCAKDRDGAGFEVVADALPSRLD
jgi:hypothetical protein